MRIVHITDRLSGRGGADLLLSALIGALAGRGIEQQLLVGRSEPGCVVRCPVHVLRGLDDTRADSVPEQALQHIAREQPDILHVHNALAPAVLSHVAERDGVATVQDHRSFCPGQGKLTLSGTVCAEAMSRSLCADCFTDEAYAERIYALTERRLTALRRMAHLIVLSHYMKRELVQAGAQPHRVAVVPPAVPRWPTEQPHQSAPHQSAPHQSAPHQSAPHEDRMRPDVAHLDEMSQQAVRQDDGPCVLFCGRLVRAKGVMDAIEAYERAGVSLPLVFAGTGSMRGEIERRGYEVLGWRAQADIGAMYRRAKAVLMPSRWQEPYGMVGPEAQLCGVPVVAYESGGIEQWHTAPELLVPWGDIEALSLALRRALSMQPSPYRARTGEEEAEDTLAVYRSVIRNRGLA